MTNWSKFLILCVLSPLAGASALDCGRATGPIDELLCSQPDLTRLDAALNRAYTELRPQLTPKARGALLAQQRPWVAILDKECATGNAECLRKLYWARMDDLQALGAVAKVSEGPLDDATPVVVKGAWKLSAVQDSLGPGHASDVDVRQSLADADPPAIGTTVHATPGQVCTVPGECEVTAFRRTAMAKIEGGNVIGPSLGIARDTLLLVGTTEASQSEPLTLVPRSDGQVWAIFGLCGPHAAHCRNAVEVWTALGVNTVR